MVGDGDVTHTEFTRPPEMILDIGVGIVAPIAMEM
jgi:hypothetical protein